MNSQLIENRIAFHHAEIDRQNLAIRILKELGDKLTESANLQPASMFWVYVDSRADVEALMTLAPRWRKDSTELNVINYRADVDGHELTIKAQAGALPPTCKLVEEEYEIPAEPAKPARKATRMVLKCPKPPEIVEEPTDSVPAVIEVQPPATVAPTSDIPFE